MRSVHAVHCLQASLASAFAVQTTSALTCNNLINSGTTCNGSFYMLRCRGPVLMLQLQLGTKGTAAQVCARTM
jgi:hypothetical protein